MEDLALFVGILFEQLIKLSNESVGVAQIERAEVLTKRNIDQIVVHLEVKSVLSASWWLAGRDPIESVLDDFNWVLERSFVMAFH